MITMFVILVVGLVGWHFCAGVCRKTEANRIFNEIKKDGE